MNPVSIPSQIFSVESHSEASKRDERIHTDDLNIVFPRVTFRGVTYNQAIINLLTGICSFYQIVNGSSLLVHKMAIKVELLPIKSQQIQFDEHE
jgi:hypothetical protein